MYVLYSFGNKDLSKQLKTVLLTAFILSGV